MTANKRHLYELGKGYLCPVTKKYTNIVFTDPDSKGIINSCMECNPDGWTRIRKVLIELNSETQKKERHEI